MLRSLVSVSRNLRTTSLFHRFRTDLGRTPMVARGRRQLSSCRELAETGIGLYPGRRYMLSHLQVSDDVDEGQDVQYSLWLAWDRKKEKYVRLESIRPECLGPFELSVYKHLSSPSRTISPPHCVSLLDHFTHADPVEVCLVTNLVGGDVTLLQRKWPCMLHFPLVKRILLHVLRGIAHMHRRGVVHTDLTPKNVLFDASCFSLNDLVHPPHPIVYLDDAMNSTYLVSNFSNAQFISDRGDANEGTDEDYRSPEVISKGPWNEKVDIWAFGCLIFELSVSKKLFRRLPHSPHCSDADECHLWQIQTMTDEKFEHDQLEESEDAPLYFDEYDRLKSDPPDWRETFASCLDNYNLLKENDLNMTAALLERCLHINPDDRATAKELLQDPFWNDVK